MRRRELLGAGLGAPLMAASGAHAAPAIADEIDAAVRKELARTGAPGATIAVVRDRRIVLARAYGASSLDPRRAAASGQRFALGSVSKQFTAAAVLLLAEDGKLSLDDPVGRWVPGLTAGDRITVRQVLSHTSGYRDYWPQDFVPPYMTQPVTAQSILDRWAKTPLDFEPGEDWRYSNTGFVLAGLIAERAGGRPLMQQQRERIFIPLGMTTATEVDSHALVAPDAQGYTRYALGPSVPAPKEAPGWLFGAGALAMTAEDLARWDLAMIERRVLKPESWAAMQTSVRLKNGRDTTYGLGVHAGSDGQARLIEHGGALSGYLAENRVWPDLGAATVVMVNGDLGDPGAIADRIGVLMPIDAVPNAADVEAARALLGQLTAGRLDRSRLTDNGASFFTPTILRAHAASLAPLGALKSLTPVSKRLRGGFTQEIYRAEYPHRTLRIVVRRDGARFEQFMIFPG